MIQPSRKPIKWDAQEDHAAWSQQVKGVRK